MKNTMRRDFLKISGLATITGIATGLLACEERYQNEDAAAYLASFNPKGVSWKSLRSQFSLDPGLIHMTCMLLATHPKPVEEAISRYRNGLNSNPVAYLHENYGEMADNVRQMAAKYMDVLPDEIALTDSTTMGTGLLMNGLHLKPGQEVLAATTDYPATHRAIDYATKRVGASFRLFSLYEDIFTVTEAEMLEKLVAAIRPETRLVTGTWVHSSTGLKIPVQRIAAELNVLNAARSPEDRVLFFLDGVHGFGVEDEAAGKLGCDFFSAGTHKWMFGPRGTGLLWGRTDVHQFASPVIPSFTRGSGWGGLMSPGGFKPFEHQWAVAAAFQMHLQLGRARVQEHIHQLCSQLKSGLAEMGHVILYTPIAESLSSGIVCFDIKGMPPAETVNRLAEKNIVASQTPYATSYARLTPGIYNSSDEVTTVLSAIQNLS